MTALALFVTVEPIDQVPCFSLGYAIVPERRGQGLASTIVQAGIKELQHGLSQHNIDAFYVEAVAGVDNHASQKVAAKTLTPTYTETVDEVSGKTHITMCVSSTMNLSR